MIIYAMTESGFALAENFKAEYPEIPIQVVSVFSLTSGKTLDELQQQTETPDIYLIDPMKLDYDYELVKNGYVADITELFDSDTSYREDMYYPGAISAGKVNDQLYALPLGMTMPYMTIREDVWKDSAFYDLPPHYTAQELFETMENELDQKGNESFRVLNGGWNVDLLAEWLWDSGAIQTNGDKYTLNQELCEQICRIICKNERNQKETETIFAGNFLDPRIADGQYEIGYWGYWPGYAPQIGLVYAQSANRALMEQDTHVLWKTMAQEVEEYAAKVSLVGAIGQNSSNQKAAYEVLRKMMDMPMTHFIMPSSLSGGTACPVNRDEALAMIQNVEEGAVETLYV